jgi:hypothetical protein
VVRDNAASLRITDFGFEGNSGSKKLVCIRELQKDLKESAKLLIEDELQEFGDLQGKIYRNLLVILVGKASATIWAVRLGFLVGRSPSDDGDATVDFISLFPTVPRRRRYLDSSGHYSETLDRCSGGGVRYGWQASKDKDARLVSGDLRSAEGRLTVSVKLRGRDEINSQVNQIVI